MQIAAPVRSRRGRPRKFLAPSRAVTLTLPEDVIDALARVDEDLSRAVVRLAQPVVARQPHPPAELAVFGRRAVILVNPTRTLEKRAGVTLIPLSDGRALISFDDSTDIANLELRLQDAVEEHGLAAADQRVFEAVAEILRTARRSSGAAVRRGNIIIIEATRSSALHSPNGSRSSRSPGRRKKR